MATRVPVRLSAFCTRQRAPPIHRHPFPLSSQRPFRIPNLFSARRPIATSSPRRGPDLETSIEADTVEKAAQAEELPPTEDILPSAVLPDTDDFDLTSDAIEPSEPAQVINSIFTPTVPLDPKDRRQIDALTARLVPGSPSYFTTTPSTTDDLLHLRSLLRAYEALPTLPPSAAPRRSWKTLVQYRLWIGEEVPAARYTKIRSILARLNLIIPELLPTDAQTAIENHLRDLDPLLNKAKPGVIDEWGRAYGHGRRKSAKAHAWLVEGDGQVLVNGRGLHNVFGRVHDRESAVWPLLATARMSRYNLWATCHGGGSTGWAEGLAMAVGRALLVHEPALKPALRRAGVIRRDPRRVERKKPGHVKARKMPTWVKR